MKRLKSILLSDKGMKLVNLLFFLALLLRNSPVVFIAYLLWIVYLVFCIRNTPSKGVKTAYKILIAFAAVMILLNLYSLVGPL